MGAYALVRSGMPASAGVRFAFRALHGVQAATVFVQVFRPPREIGTM